MCFANQEIQPKINSSSSTCAPIAPVAGVEEWWGVGLITPLGVYHPVPSSELSFQAFWGWESGRKGKMTFLLCVLPL